MIRAFIGMPQTGTNQGSFFVFNMSNGTLLSRMDGSKFSATRFGAAFAFQGDVGVISGLNLTSPLFNCSLTSSSSCTEFAHGDGNTTGEWSKQQENGLMTIFQHFLDSGWMLKMPHSLLVVAKDVQLLCSKIPLDLGNNSLKFQVWIPLILEDGLMGAEILWLFLWWVCENLFGSFRLTF